MDAQDTLNKLSARTGWNESSMLAIACRYIDNQDSSAAFLDFVTQQADEEDPDVIIEIGDEVDVPEPQEDDGYNHAFRGTVIGFKDQFAKVRDQDENVFDIELDRLILVND